MATKRKTAAKRAATPKTKAAGARKTDAKTTNGSRQAAKSRSAPVRKRPAAKKGAAAKAAVGKAPARKPPRRPSSGGAARSGAARKNAPATAAALPCGDEALRRATGKGWDEWLGLLDALGAKALDHARIWQAVMTGLPDSAGWWGQMVAVGYERARGLHEGEDIPAGDFAVSISKTLPVPLFAAFAACADEALRGRWLDASGLDVTRLDPGQSLRARWPDGSRLELRFEALAPDQCRIVVDATRLADGASVGQTEAYWKEQFERLRAYLTV